ncbi:MAG: FAD-binding protein [Deltaproteobacteria bacterium]|nr:FAD-binding protein [Deltaproteobacteria bacterium]
MYLKYQSPLSCDVLVIGGGGASLWAALKAKEMGADVVLASKSKVGLSNNTYIAGGLIAVAGMVGQKDSVDLYLKDTITGGRFLNDRKLVVRMAEEAKTLVSPMEGHGIDFARDETGLQLRRVPGHSHPRHISPSRPRGLNYLYPLKDSARKLGIRLLDKLFITKLYSVGGQIAGASGLTDDGGFQAISAKCIILTTGGYGHVYRRTNNAAGITGDGLALAYGLGAGLMDLEFIQFYPTAMGNTGAQMIFYEFLVAQAGARLINSKGEDVVIKHNLDDPMSITRDRLARAIAIEISRGLDVDGGLLLDLGPVKDEHLRKAGDMIPMKWLTGEKRTILAPTTHFCMGGVMMDDKAETAVPGLFAAGEVCGGLHGANRLAGNALAEVFAMGGLAGRNAALKAADMEKTPQIPPSLLDEEKERLAYNPGGSGRDVRTLTAALKEAMWAGAGVIRDAASLKTALAQIEELKTSRLVCPKDNVCELKKFQEFENMLLLSEMICRSALLRTESRGSHYRTDFPEEDNNWIKNIVVRKDDPGMKIEAVAVG